MNYQDKLDKGIKILIVRGGYAESSDMRAKTCQFKGSRKHCAMTTQETCEDCKFYQPTIRARHDMFLDHCIDLDEDNHNLQNQIEICNRRQLVTSLHLQRVMPDAAIGKAIKRHRKKIKRAHRCGALMR